MPPVQPRGRWSAGLVLAGERLRRRAGGVLFAGLVSRSRLGLLVAVR